MTTEMPTMDPSSDTTKGFEILDFEDAEITQTSSSPGSNSDPITGVLKVFFFPEFERFFLMLNDISYPLIHSLTITCADKAMSQPRVYTLPLRNSFYILKLNKISHPNAIENFETILAHNCKFFFEGDPTPVRKGEMSPKRSSGETFEPSSELPGTVEGVEDKPMKDPKVKRSFFSKAASTFSKVFSGAGKNSNMTSVRTIAELKDVSKDFLTSNDFPREEIESTIDSSRRIVDITEQSWETTITTTIFSEFTVTYPKEIMETEERLIREIKESREVQSKSIMKQQKYREKQLTSSDNERELQDQLNSLRDQKMRIEISQREQMYVKELAKKDVTLQIHENQLARECQEFKKREKALTDEIQSKIMELKAKEQLTQEEQAEFNRREQELVDLNKSLEGERSEMEKRHQALRQQAQAKESEIKEKEGIIETQKSDFMKREEELRRVTEQRLNELKKKEKMTEEERIEFERKQKELDQTNISIEKERVNLDKKLKEAQVNSQRELAELQKKEQLAESERAEFLRKRKVLETDVHDKLAELQKKEKLTEAEAKELKKREKELSKMAKQTEADQINLQKKDEKLNEQIRRREAELHDQEMMTENERSELIKIKDRLEKETKLTEVERKDLMSMRDKMMQDVEQRKAEILEREKLTEAERKELERKGQEAEKKLQMRLAQLKEKERLTEEERIEMKQREEEFIKINKVKEMEVIRSQSKLDEIRRHEEELLAQNEKMIRGHMEVQKNVVELQQELDKPSVVQVQVSSMTSRVGEVKTGEIRSKTEEKSIIVEPHETTTSG